MNDSVVYTDTIRVSYMMKLTDKTDTDTVYVFLGNGPDKTNIDSAMFTISNNAGTYYATSTELGTYEIYGRMLIVEKTYLKSELSDPFWGTAYLINGSAQESEKKYYKNILP
ncbi:MAG: hypothetical protein JXR48_01970 [Candidatus Delongbacteria bacterium]|nr:hypothetical protein [Candidatus Delongbacteria bacterium]